MLLLLAESGHVDVTLPFLSFEFLLVSLLLLSVNGMATEFLQLGVSVMRRVR